MGGDRGDASAGVAPRTLAEHLAGSTDEALAEVFRARPDLARPIPHDIPALAEQACSPPSVRIAWLRLNRLEQQVLEVLVAGGPMSARALLDAVAAGAPDPSAAAAPVAAALDRCRSMALVWGDDALLRTVPEVSRNLGQAPCGLDPTDRSGSPLIASYVADPDAFAALMATAPPAAAAALDALLWGPPRGSLTGATRQVSAASAATPVEWLLARGLLVPDGGSSVVLPREVSLLLRRGRFLREPALPPGPPVVAGAGVVDDADAAAGMHALAAARSARQLLRALDEGAVRVLRNGGVYHRDGAELARRLGLSLRETALLADALLRAGLIATDTTAGTWGLTRSADVWLGLEEPQQWAALALGWRDTPTNAALVDDTGADRRMLSDSLHSPGAAEIRRLVLQLAGAAPPGRPVDAQLLAHSMLWHRPRLGGGIERATVADVLQDAEFLGLVARGAPSSSGRLLADPQTDPKALADSVAWPALVAKVVLQADLTATAMGPLTQPALQRLELLADRESAGAGSVYRFSAASVQRAFDEGRSTQEVGDEVRSLSLTGVPSTLEALIADVGRRHGAIRVGRASCVVTADDDAVLQAAIADRSLAHLQLRRLAPGVAVSTAAAAEVTAGLRRAGVSAVGMEESRSLARRRLVPPAPVVTAGPTEADVAVAVRAVRAGESAKAALAGPRRLVAASPHELVGTLQAAIIGQGSVWLDVADATGTRRIRRVQPLTLRSGVLAGFDERDRRVLSFPLSRIAGIARIPDIPGN